MIDAEFNPAHCDGCHQECAPCQEAYQAGPVVASKTLFGSRADTGKRFIVRYTQDRFRESLRGTVTA